MQRIHEPALHGEFVALPVDALGFAPHRLARAIVGGDGAPLADRAGPDFRAARSRSGGSAAQVRPSAATETAVCSLARDRFVAHPEALHLAARRDRAARCRRRRRASRRIRCGRRPARRSISPRSAIPGVRLRTDQPAAPADATKISPPVTSSSLIRPPMKAMDLPSGDQRGFSICCCGPGWKTTFVSPAVGGDGIELGDPPVVVADAMRGRGGERLAVGRPVVFVDVEVGGRNLADGAGGGIDNRDALLVNLLFDHAFVGSFGLERPGHARRILGEEHGDRFAVGRPARMRQISGQAGELARRRRRWRP